LLRGCLVAHAAHITPIWHHLASAGLGQYICELAGSPAACDGRAGSLAEVKRSPSHKVYTQNASWWEGFSAPLKLDHTISFALTSA